MSAAGEPLFHLVPRTQWADAKASGQPYFPSTYAADGFIHLTKDPALLLSVANHFYTGPPSTPCAPLFPEHFCDSEVQVMLTQATCRCEWRLRCFAVESLETHQQGVRIVVCGCVWRQHMLLLSGIPWLFDPTSRIKSYAGGLRASSSSWHNTAQGQWC